MYYSQVVEFWIQLVRVEKEKSIISCWVIIRVSFLLFSYSISLIAIKSIFFSRISELNQQ